MKFCAIAPIAHLEQTKDNDIHMALAHLVDNPKYVEFMKSQVNEGKMIILDNSIIELGKAIPIDDLLEAARKIDAHEIIIPDGYKSAKQTVAYAEQYIPRLRKEYPGRIMAVAHGKSVDEWAWCAKRLIELGVDTLGIPKVMCEILGPNGRKMCLRQLKRMFMAGQIHNIPTLHLLGIWSEVLEVAEIEHRDFLNCRSVDSVIGFKYASYGLHFEDGIRPEGPVDFYTATCNPLVHLENIVELRKLCREDNRPVAMGEKYRTAVYCPPIKEGNTVHVEFGEGTVRK